MPALEWAMRRRLPVWALLSCLAAAPAQAQDALRGAQLYLRLAGGVPSCVGCHGHDPTQGRNNMLRAADDPTALLKALNAVGPMGYLKSVLRPEDVADLSAYLGRVRAAANPQGPVAAWPATIDFGRVPDGGVSPQQHVTLLNRDVRAWRIEPRVEGAGFELVHDCPAQLAPGAACSARVRARPAAGGVATGALVWAGDASWSPLVVGLAVDSVPSSVGELVPSNPGERLQFAAQAVGGTLQLDWPLLNRGSAATTPLTLTVSGPQADQFAVAGDCLTGRAIPPGQGCTVAIRHTARVPGQAQAALQLHGDGTSPAALGLNGEGLAVSPPPAPVPASSGGGMVDWRWLAGLVMAVIGLRRPARGAGRRQS